MSTEAIDGKAAGGYLATWVVPVASASDPTGTEGAWEAPLTLLTAVTTIKVDCYMDFGDVTTTFSPTTTTKQRMCEKIARTVQTGETIDVVLAGVYDQNSDGSEAAVNAFYDEVPKGADVYVVRAYGWDSDVTPTTATVVDVYKGSVQSRTKTEPTTAEEDLKFAATVSVSKFFEDVTLTAA